jgi:hypothetical protein
MAIVGAPVAGVGAAPGVAAASTGKAISLVGTALEISVEWIAGSDKNAGIVFANEATYRVLGKVGEKAVDQLLPGTGPILSAEINLATKETVGFLEAILKRETDKTVQRVKDK